MQTTTPAAKLDRAPIAILGVPFDNVDLAETLALAGEMIASGQPHCHDRGRGFSRGGAG